MTRCYDPQREIDVRRVTLYENREHVVLNGDGCRCSRLNSLLLNTKSARNAALTYCIHTVL